MVVIRVPKPPASASNPDRPISTLLKNQIVHLQEAEFRLPANKQTNIYINDIKTEGQASEYIQQVTARLHPAAAPRKAKRKTSKRTGTKSGFTIAAAGQKKRKAKGKPKAKAKKVVKAKKKRR